MLNAVLRKPYLHPVPLRPVLILSGLPFDVIPNTLVPGMLACLLSVPEMHLGCLLQLFLPLGQLFLRNHGVSVSVSSHCLTTLSLSCYTAGFSSQRLPLFVYVCPFPFISKFVVYLSNWKTVGKVKPVS